MVLQGRACATPAKRRKRKRRREVDEKVAICVRKVTEGRKDFVTFEEDETKENNNNIIICFITSKVFSNLFYLDKLTPL